jgi:hypothetical protein
MVMSIDDLRTELRTVTSSSDAKAMLNRAARIAGVSANRPLEMRELLLVCEALAAEGGPIQLIAEAIATRALR